MLIFLRRNIVMFVRGDWMSQYRIYAPLNIINLKNLTIHRLRNLTNFTFFELETYLLLDYWYHMTMWALKANLFFALY